MKKNYESCNFLSPVVMEASVSYYPISAQIKNRILKFKNITLYNLIHPNKPVAGRTSKTFSLSPENNTLNLQPGEWAQVRSIDEISATLDENNKYKGLYFMPEMEKFCGEKFKVFKKVERIKLESDGEVRILKSPTVFLEGAYCNGERHMGCGRACFHFWKEAWLKRSSDD
jgi:hypothetical protein